MGKERRKTKTSTYGSPGRECHDSSEFYNSRLYTSMNDKPPDTHSINPVPATALDKLFYKSSESMTELPDNCLHLMVTSPPYNAGKTYDDDLSLEQYRSLLRLVWNETYRVLVPGGRACVNIANLGRKPYIPLHSYLIEDMLSLGFLMRGEIIWNKSASAGSSTAWGSWCSATNPVLRDTHEYIMIFCKDTFARPIDEKTNDVTRDEFLEWTKSVWSFPSVSARTIGHPAPFPEELPRRLIKLYSFVGDVVLDPFCGSGTTCLAANRNNRHYIGYDNNLEYIELAEGRLRKPDMGR